MKRAGQRGGDQLQPQGRHAGGFGRELIVADRGKAEAEPRVFDRARDRDRDHRQRQHHAGTDSRYNRSPMSGDCRRPDDIGAARAADKIPVGDQRLHHDRHRQRGDREERAAQPQRQIADAEPDDARTARRRSASSAGSASGVSLVRARRTRIGAEREERRRCRNSHSRCSRRGCSRRSPARYIAARHSRRRTHKRCRPAARATNTAARRARCSHETKSAIRHLAGRTVQRAGPPASSSRNPNATAGAQDGP